jgi:hypothetical protein
MQPGQRRAVAGTSAGKPSVVGNDASVKFWMGLVALVAVLAFGAYSFRSRQENLSCQRSVQVEHGPSCHKYTYWWDR